MIDKIINKCTALFEVEDIVNYLFDKKTISQAASKLKPNEFPILEIKLKVLIPAKTTNEWIRLVKKQNQPDRLSHIDISNIYLKTHGVNTLYARSSYHRYENGVWVIFPEIKFLGEIRDMLEDLEKKHESSFTHSQQKSIASFITQKIARNDDELDARPNLINMKNGTFCIDMQMLFPHDPKDLLTTQLPFDYDDSAIPKRWYHFLETTFVIKDVFGAWQQDDEIASLLQEAIGYSLTSSMVFHKSFWCLGEGSNGKGVLFHIIDALGGSAATAFNLDMLNQTYNTYHLAELAGKRLVYCTEVSKNFDFSGDAIFKALTGGDKIQVRPIREQPFVMESVSKFWLSMNDIPTIKDTSHGFWRRIAIIPFNRQFADGEQDLNLREDLEKELSGIFNWSMIGLNRLMRNSEFTQSTQVDALTKQHRIESNTVQMFVNEECEEDKSYSEIITPLYKAYVEWCKNTINQHPYSRKNFKKELGRLKFEGKTTSKGSEIFGLKLKPFDAFSGKII